MVPADSSNSTVATETITIEQFDTVIIKESDMPSTQPVNTPTHSQPPHSSPQVSTPPTEKVGEAQDEGLSRSDKISLGVGLGVGVPGVIASIYAVASYYRRFGW